MFTGLGINVLFVSYEIESLNKLYYPLVPILKVSYCPMNLFIFKSDDFTDLFDKS